MFSIILSLLIVAGTIYVDRVTAAQNIGTVVGTGNGSISGSVRLFPNEQARQYINGQGYIPGEAALTYYDQVAVRILNANGDTLGVTLSGAENGAGNFSFTGLEDGTYYVEIADTNIGGIEHVPWKGDVNFFDGDEVRYQRENKSQAIQVTGGNAVDKVTFVLVRRPYAMETTTNVGKFEYTVGGQAQSGTTLQYYRGGVYSFENAGRTYSTVLGVLATDKLNHIRNSLAEPVLSDEEIAYGYSFAGWTPNDSMLDRYPELAGKIFTTTEALNIVAVGDMSFRAVFTYPIYRVTFATDIEKGDIEGSAYKSYELSGNNTKLPEVPSVNVKDGYRFIGWYTDATTNVISANDIKNMKHTSNNVFYAKYASIDKEISKPPVLNAMFQGDTSVNGKGVAGAEIKLVSLSGDIKTTKVADDGNWSFSVDELKLGEIYAVKQIEKNKAESNMISGTVVKRNVDTSSNPIINAVTEGDKIITGKGTANASVQITFKDGTNISTRVADDGTWSIAISDDVKLSKGDIVSAVQTEANKFASSSIDATVMEKKLEKSANPIVDAIKAKDTVITGKGIAKSSVEVTFKDGSKVKSIVGSNGLWAVKVPSDIQIQNGDNISAVQTEIGKLPSSAVDGTAVLDEKNITVNSKNVVWDKETLEYFKIAFGGGNKKYSGTPRTGDESATALFVSFMILSGGTFLVARNRKAKK